MEERVKLVEAQLTVLQNQVTKMDQALGMVLQWVLHNKQFLDALQVNRPPEVNTEEKKDVPAV